MDGSNRKAIVRESLIWPNGLCIDYTVSRIYWADAKHHVIESSKFDGMDRKKVRRHSGDISGKVRGEMEMNSMLLLHCKYSSCLPFINTHAKPRKQTERVNRARMQVTTGGNRGKCVQSRGSCSANGWEQWRTEGGVWGVQTPPEIPKISVESSIAQARRTGVSISFYSSLCSHTVVIY